MPLWLLLLLLLLLRAGKLFRLCESSFCMARAAAARRGQQQQTIRKRAAAAAAPAWAQLESHSGVTARMWGWARSRALYLGDRTLRVMMRWGGSLTENVDRNSPPHCTTWRASSSRSRECTAVHKMP